ncbi:MAG: DUF4234 domain-containing protein [Candidatus Babeliales bacterium]
MTSRNLWQMIILILITLGIYPIYWLVATKIELNKLGAQIPTAWLLIIPFVNLYFLYKFAEAFAIYVLKDKTQIAAYFLLITLLWPIGEIIYQDQINKKAILV